MASEGTVEDRNTAVATIATRLFGTRVRPANVITESLERVGLSDPARRTTTAQLSAARGEYESFQIVVRASGSGVLSNVTVTVSDLTNPTGQSISKANVEMFREQYVYVNSSSPDWRGSNRPLGPGWYADGLIPFRDPDTGAPPVGGHLRGMPFNLAAGRNQPVWVDVFVPRTAAAGQYTGSFTVTSDQGSASGQIGLRVWNFTLPLKPALKSAFVVQQAPANAVARTLLRNKVSPLSIEPQQASDLVEHFGLNSGNVGFWSGADVSHCSMSPAPAASAILAAAKKYPPGLDLYNFMADEIGGCTSLYPQIRMWALTLHHAGVKNMITMAPVPELLDDGSGTGRSAVDVWVVLPMTYNKSAGIVQRALRKGDSVWSYNTLVQDPYSPKWEIDFAPINFRIQPGFISQSLNLTGVLYWRVDDWSSDPWNKVNNAGKFSSNNYPGEGILIYPGQMVEVFLPLPDRSIRNLKGRVVRTRGAGAGLYEIGVEFTEMEIAVN